MVSEDVLRHLRDVARELSPEARMKLLLRAFWVILLTPEK
jgi:hypothetical protein